MENLIKQLKTLKNIHPSKAFAERSKFLIFIKPEPRIFSSSVASLLNHYVSYINLTRSLAFLTSAIVIAILISNSMPSNNMALAGLVDSKLEEEMQVLNTEIKSPALDYYTDSDKVIETALKEISEDSANHLNSRLLQKEAKELIIEDPINKKIDNLLDGIIDNE